MSARIVCARRLRECMAARLGRPPGRAELILGGFAEAAGRLHGNAGSSQQPRELISRAVRAGERDEREAQ